MSRCKDLHSNAVIRSGLGACRVTRRNSICMYSHGRTNTHRASFIAYSSSVGALSSLWAAIVSFNWRGETSPLLKASLKSRLSTNDDKWSPAHVHMQYKSTSLQMHACTRAPCVCIWRSFALWRKFCIKLKPTIGKSRCSQSSQRSKTWILHLSTVSAALHLSAGAVRPSILPHFICFLALSVNRSAVFHSLYLLSHACVCVREREWNLHLVAA